MWNQLKYQRKNSLLANTQRSTVNLEHTFSKARAKKPNIHEVEEKKEEVTVLPPPSNFILSEEEIEICETTDVWECDNVLKFLLKPYRC